MPNTPGSGLPGVNGEDVTQLVDFSGAARPFVELAADAGRAAVDLGKATDKLADDLGEAQADEKIAKEEFDRRSWWVPGSSGYNAAMR